MGNIIDDFEGEPSPEPKQTHRERFIEELEQKAPTSATARAMLAKLRAQSDEQARELDLRIRLQMEREKEQGLYNEGHSHSANYACGDGCPAYPGD